MNTVTELEMALAMRKAGGLGAIHRYMTIEEQTGMMQKLPSPKLASISVNGNAKDRVNSLITKSNVDLLVFDVAHGDMKNCHDMVRWIKSEYGSAVKVISGNIVTPSAAERYYAVDVDCFRVGIGAGSACTTRTVAGVGYNQLHAIKEIREAFPTMAIVNDGGIRNSGDLVKVLAAGADCTFIGSLLVAAKESPAEVRIIDNKMYKVYAGMASEYAERKRIERTKEEERAIDHLIAPEGQEVLVPYQADHIEAILNRLVQGLKHGMAYLGAETIPQMWARAQWTKP